MQLAPAFRFWEKEKKRCAGKCGSLCHVQQVLTCSWTGDYHSQYCYHGHFSFSVLWDRRNCCEDHAEEAQSKSCVFSPNVLLGDQRNGSKNWNDPLHGWNPGSTPSTICCHGEPLGVAQAKSSSGASLGVAPKNIKQNSLPNCHLGVLKCLLLPKHKWEFSGN